MATFIDRLQELAPALPLRTIPLKIEVFTPVVGRLDDAKNAALQNQLRAVEAWQRELEARFTSAQRATPITEVALTGASS